MKRRPLVVGLGSLVAAGIIGGSAALALSPSGHTAAPRVAVVQRSDATAPTTTTTPATVAPAVTPTTVAPTPQTSAQASVPAAAAPSVAPLPTTPAPAAPAPLQPATTPTTTATVTVPNVVGMGYTDATNAVDSAGLQTGWAGLPPCAGAVTAATESPSGGSQVAPGSTVALSGACPGQ